MDIKSQPTALTLRQLNERIRDALTVAPGLNNVWVVAETSDVRTSGGHCYMELLQKDEAGAALARTRAVIWANTYARLGAAFAATTGNTLASDMKVMVCVSTNFHPVYGLSLVITDINPEYTAGDLVRRRNEIIRRLQAEGMFDLNRTLSWVSAPQRVAVISAQGAAGYGDFVKHLLGNPRRLRFEVSLFPAVMQGEKTVGSVIAALEAIAERLDDFDCVVLIRGGGAVSDLCSFDDYDLAANVAQFPLPIIVGIGHERDVTVLDYIANIRVKTPTAAAEHLIGMAQSALDSIVEIAQGVANAVAEKFSGRHRQLEYYRGQLPALVRAVIIRGQAQLGEQTKAMLRQLPTAAIARERQRLDVAIDTLHSLPALVLERRRARLDAVGEILETLAPEATLRRGYSITRVSGCAVTNSAELREGALIETTFADGATIISTVKERK